MIEGLNERQHEVLLDDGKALLILAGAGSGKTKTVTTKIAYLLEEKGISPYRILAFTFTNKAAREMRDRLEALLGRDTAAMWMGTFHSVCVRILRVEGTALGYGSSFSIYDRDDQKTLVRECIKDLGINKQMMKENSVLAFISDAKNRGESPEFLQNLYQGDYHNHKMAEIFALYQKRCKENNAMDFDDLLLETVRLFDEHPEIRKKYQEKFHYIFVDEYQDTNKVQYQLIRHLCGDETHLTVVGDNDQSIYGWRGADISNIEDFEKDFPGAKVVLLEQNYRSTKNILSAANRVIGFNENRRKKHLWTENGDGAPVEFCSFASSDEEERDVAQKIAELSRQGMEFSQMAILYRTNAQSRGFEEYLMRRRIPYRVVGGLKFYDRAEVKDIVSYLRAIINLDDDVAMQRIINTPKRGIGTVTVEGIRERAQSKGTSFFTALEKMAEGGDAKAVKLRSFATMIRDFSKKAKTMEIAPLIEEVMRDSGMVASFEDENTLESRRRLENLEEFLSAAAGFAQENPEARLEDYLASVSLLSDVDKTKDDEEGVSLMTIHAAKGLEYPVVFVVGLEEGLFPSQRSLEDHEALAEERRLCYVALTRAEHKLFLSGAYNRRVFGKNMPRQISRFIEEMGPTIEHQASESTKHIQAVKKPQMGRPHVDVRDYKRTRELYEKQVAHSEDLTEEKKRIHAASKVYHKKWGHGMVVAIDGDDDDPTITISFDKKGLLKKLRLSAAPLEVLS